jgi:hypothetical protein
LAAVVTALLERIGGTKQAPAASAVALAAGAILGCWLRDALALPGDTTWNRLPWAVLAVLCAGRVVAALPALDGWIVRAGTALALTWWVIPVEARTELTWLAPAFAAVVLLEWGVLDSLAAQPPGGTVPFALALTFGAASGVLIHAGTARLTDVAIVLASALTGIALVAWWRRADASGAMPAVALLLPGVLLLGQQETFSEVSWHAFALAAGAPLLLAVTVPLRRWEGVGLRLVQLTLVLLPLAAALYLARLAGPLEW